jgi:ethanolamine utilization protein EutM
MSKALGLVETRGLVAAIEAADAMVKAANVKLIGKERTDPALITIKVTGETAAVKASVDAGVQRLQAVSEF